MSVNQKVLKRIEDLYAVVEFHFSHSDNNLLGAASALVRGDLREAVDRHADFLEFATKHQGLHEAGPVIVQWAKETQVYLEILLDWDQGSHEVGHDPDKIVKQYNANKWNHLTLKSGTAYRGYEFFNDHWVGIHHPYNGKPLKDVAISDLYAHDNFPWTSRGYEWQENISIINATTVRNRREHFWYENLVGLGRNVSQKEANKRTAVLMDNHYAEDCDAQWWQFVGANPKDPQRLNETGMPQEDAWSPAGRVIRKNMKGKLLGRGKDTGHPDRVGFVMSDFPYQSALEFENIELDNRGVKKGGGAWLIQGHPEAHATNVSIDFTGVDADKELIKIEDTPLVVIKGSRLIGGSRKQFFINRCDKVVLEDIDTNLVLRVDGQPKTWINKGYQHG